MYRRGSTSSRSAGRTSSGRGATSRSSATRKPSRWPSRPPSSSRSPPPTAWSRRHAASSTSTDRGHQRLYGSALPDDGGGARGEMAQTRRGPGEGGRDAGRGRDRQGRDGSGGARGRRAAPGGRPRGPNRCGRERGGGDRLAWRGRRCRASCRGPGDPFGKGGTGNGKRGDGDGGCSDRKSTRLNSSHLVISYARFCFEKKK